jgi:hypothetical protein
LSGRRSKARSISRLRSIAAFISEIQKALNAENPKFPIDKGFGKTEIARGMEPARTIVQKLGGPAIVAEITGAASTAPYRWQYTRAKGGTGGVIPQRHHRKLLDYAREKNIELKAEDFLPEVVQ